MITTCEVTSIELLTDDQAAIIEENKDLSNIFIAADFKENLAADDVVILKNQIFIRDVPDQVSAQ